MCAETSPYLDLWFGVHWGNNAKRALETRISEHQAAVRRGETEKSAVADHAWTNQHNLKWENTTIIDGSRNKHNYIANQGSLTHTTCWTGQIVQHGIVVLPPLNVGDLF